ncbi:MAG: alanine--glyoxylate aminotransferase family protein [Chloroflexi bacterium]|nr:alanine--glyoxylate aminotransferase family protein [Chloroflexota bacterium]
MTEESHIRLVLPGPVEVRREILEAQTAWMIGHRQPAFAQLYAQMQTKLQQTFLTEGKVFVVASSGTGFWEGASRNCIRDDRKALHLVSGAFSERWAKISQANGKQIDVIELDWGQGFSAEMVADALKKDRYDALCVVHNETSTGVLNPIQAIGEVVAEYDETLYLVDTVSGYLGAELRVDDWQVDLALTSSQKAFALPPGLAACTINEAVLERAKQIEHRGYYFDFLNLDKYHGRDNTPSTPPISLMVAADKQLDDILTEGLEGRWARHEQMRQITAEWVEEQELGFYAEAGYRSPTITAVANTRGVDVPAMADFMLNEKHFAIDKGYGKIKGDTFRIAHMGDMTIETLQEVLAGLSDFLGKG